MVRLKWDNEDSPMYQTGVSQGVFYGDDGVGHAWSGLISVTEKPQNNAPTAVYNAMGEKYDNFGNVAEKKHGLACYVYPEVMEDYLGYEYLEDFGFVADERPPKKFHMAYRVELGNGLYEIHVLLNQIATFGETARQTMADSLALSTITMNLEGAVDPRLGTSHIRLDSRLPVTKSAEILLFGDQYTDANIHDFLTAEPVWETVATNYAPIIEPDYDNMVWLGGENLVNRIRDLSVPLDYNSSYAGILIKNSVIYHAASIYYGSHTFAIGDTITVTIKGYVPPGRSGFRLNALLEDGLAPSMGGMMYYDGDNIYRQVYTFTESINNPVLIRLYSAMNQDEAQNNPGDVYIEWVKIERGSIPTPWTPDPSDPDQKPRPSDPYPENYKPGVKYAETWDQRNFTQRRALCFYDEMTGGLGIYNTSDVQYNAYVAFRPFNREVHRGAHVRASVNVHIRDSVDISQGWSGRLRLADQNLTSPPMPSQRGVHRSEIESESLVVTEFSSALTAYARGDVSTTPIVLTDLMVVNGWYQGEFFDAYSTPKTKGDRYVRVPYHYGDYTIHQQLRLRSTGKVKLSNITQYDFWLEAADTMLLSQNETFTFNGPQAVIDGDTFTIDDSIQGYAEG